MNLEGGFVLWIGVFFLIPVLLWLPHLVNKLAGAAIVPPWLPIALLPVALVGGSLYLDRAGSVRQATVTGKREDVRIMATGSWTRVLSVQVEYPSSPREYPVPVSLGVDAAAFDALRIGQTVEVRALEWKRVFKFARLRSRSTLSLLTWMIPNRPRGPWRQSTAVVEDVTHVTDYSWHDGDTSNLRWPYDVVRLSFVPEGTAQAVVAVDMVEAASVHGVVKDSRVPISWPVDQPRAAHIAGSRPASPWLNQLFAFGESIGGTAVVFALGFGLIGLIGLLRWWR